MRLTPPHLQPVLSRVKQYVERQPEGVTLTQLTRKVNPYNELSRKDKQRLITILRESGQICVVNEGNLTTLHHQKFGHEATISVAAEEAKPVDNTVNKAPVTPEELRQQAQALIQAAEAAEKKAGDRAALKKQLDPLKLEILQSYGMASRKFDEFVDAMADMGKAVQKLKDIVL